MKPSTETQSSPDRLSLWTSGKIACDRHDQREAPVAIRKFQDMERISNVVPLMTYRKKLIEVALPLEAINMASAREKSIRHGHPSTLHLWWARRPLAAARAVIFAQMVDDPSAHPDLLPDREGAGEGAPAAVPHHRGPGAVGEHHQRGGAGARRGTRSGRAGGATCAENADHPRAKELFDRHKLPAFHDPFAGGGALPLEAQRLGLESYASDLNPVAVLINKAMIEIPPKFAGQAAGEPRVAQGQGALRAGRGRARRGWPRTCATTASGCATRPRSASATSTRRSRSRRRWRRSGPT